MTCVDELFTVEYGNKLDMNKMTPSTSEAGVAFIGRKGISEGISGYVMPVPGLVPYRAGMLTVALGGSILSSFVQQRSFYTAQNVAVLEPRGAMSLHHRLYYAMCIRHNAFRYTTFGREANRTLGTIELPDEPPEWVDDCPLPTVEGLSKPAKSPVPLPDPSSWADFVLGEVFEIKKGKRVTRADRMPGPTRFIGAAKHNNGVVDHVDIEPMFPAGCITVPYNGVGATGMAFYQDEPFCASDDVNVLLPPPQAADMHALLFVCTMIRHERGRFSYGYKWGLKRMKATTIRLPSNESREPDWQGMSRFVQGLPFSGSIAQASASRR